jgi:protein-disulfide isomerase
MDTSAAINRTSLLQSDDHGVGPDHDVITIIAYCDFECPYCGRAYSVVKDLRTRLKGRFRFVYRHFPLVEKHPLAQQAAEAAEAAAGQGNFWAMHDLLFENQEKLETQDLYGYANMAGLDLPQFKDDLHGRRYATRVMRDVRSGRRAGVSGTPTFLINDRLYTDEESLEYLVLQAT